MSMSSSRPYFLRALHEWIVDNGLTPHLMVDATMPGVSVPTQYIKDGKIVLNVAPEAIVDLDISNDWVKFRARFSGVEHVIRLPMQSVGAIYAVENGRGMVFEQEPIDSTDGSDDDIPPDFKPPKKDGPSRPNLKIIK